MEKLYAPPKGKSKEFKVYWNNFISKLVKRANFDETYLYQLEVLCDLYIDYHILTKFIRENGYSFITDGRYGETSRKRVEAMARNEVLKEIRAYTKMLGLELSKEIAVEDDRDEWV